MRTIYLIRHCEPDRDKVSRCISQAEECLSEVGQEQAEALRRWAAAHPVSAVYSSPRKRCQETASVMAPEMTIHIKNDLNEICVGQWEGIPFSEIKERWPLEYEARGAHPGTAAPPDGESFFEAGERLSRTITDILKETKGDVAILTHAGILRGWLCKCLEMPEQDLFSIQISFGSITEAVFDGGKFMIKRFGVKPEPAPGPREIQSLFERYGTPESVQEHGYKVAEKAMELAGETAINERILATSCILHDLCRPDGRSHPRLAAEALKKAGYTELSACVRQHHDLEPDAGAEEELLYLADKMIRGIDEISLEERFEKSRAKCGNAEALASWTRRYEDAKRLMIKYGGTAL